MKGSGGGEVGTRVSIVCCVLGLLGDEYQGRRSSENKRFHSVMYNRRLGDGKCEIY